MIKIAIADTDGVVLSDLKKQIAQYQKLSRSDKLLNVLARNRNNVLQIWVKPKSNLRLKAELERVIRVIETQKKEAIIIKNKGNYYRVYLTELRYIETDGNYTKLHTERGITECRKRMKEYESLLKDKGFVRCHNSYIVNLDYIQIIERTRIILKTGEILFVSKARKKHTRDKFIRHVGNIV